VTIAQHLSQENNDIVIIDKNDSAFERVTETLDVMVQRGNGLSSRVLSLAGVSETDLVIAVTHSDESNILCALTAKKLGAKHTIARVRDPDYASDLNSFRTDLGLDLIINPEYQAALEIARLLHFTSADNIDTFVSGRVELVSFHLSEGSSLIGKNLQQAFPRDMVDVLVATVERGNEAIIPHGTFTLQLNDVVRVMGSIASINRFFSYIGSPRSKVKQVMVVGGGIISQYLVRELLREKIAVKLIEIDRKRCEELNETLPGCTIIHGDGTDEDLLEDEDVAQTDAVISLTSRDEENVFIGLYALNLGAGKAIVRINNARSSLVRQLGLSSTVAPQSITAYQIIRYVRGLQSRESSSSIRTMYKIAQSETGYVEALEFAVTSTCRCLGIPIKDMPLKTGILVGCIVRQGVIISPSGNTSIHPGDTVVIIAKDYRIDDLEDILQEEDDLLSSYPPLESNSHEN